MEQSTDVQRHHDSMLTTEVESDLKYIKGLLIFGCLLFAAFILAASMI